MLYTAYFVMEGIMEIPSLAWIYWFSFVKISFKYVLTYLHKPDNSFKQILLLFILFYFLIFLGFLFFIYFIFNFLFLILFFIYFYFILFYFKVSSPCFTFSGACSACLSHLFVLHSHSMDYFFLILLLLSVALNFLCVLI